MYISIFRNVAVLSKDIGTIQTRNSDAHKLQHLVGRLINTCVPHFNYGLYLGFVVILHNLQASTTPSIMVPARFRFTCLECGREREWVVPGGGRADDLLSSAGFSRLVPRNSAQATLFGPA